MGFYFFEISTDCFSRGTIFLKSLSNLCPRAFEEGVQSNNGWIYYSNNVPILSSDTMMDTKHNQLTGERMKSIILYLWHQKRNTPAYLGIIIHYCVVRFLSTEVKSWNLNRSEKSGGALSKRFLLVNDAQVAL